MDLREFFPEIEPYRTKRLKVSDLHTIYVEEVGNPEGVPILFLLQTNTDCIIEGNTLERGAGISAGNVVYFPLATNTGLRGQPTGLYFEGFPTGTANYPLYAAIDPDGSFRMVVPPGGGSGGSGAEKCGRLR